MKFIPSLVVLALFAAAANAQQTTPPTPPAAPVPPASPTPVTAPTPLRAPKALLLPPDYDWSLYGKAYIDADRLRFDSERLAQEMKERAVEMSRNAIEMTRDMKLNGLHAQEAAEHAMDKVRDMQYNINVAPMVELSGKIATSFAPYVELGKNFATTYANEFAYNIDSKFSAPMAYTPGQARWEWGQDPDPADSILKLARDAMNRGEYRRSADLFSAARTRFPKSTQLNTASYYEALMRYRLGSTDELKTALRLLTENVKTTSNSEASNEIRYLTTRIRGTLAARGDEDSRRIVQSEAEKGGCDREDMQVRAEALSQLAQMDMNAAMPSLRKVLDKKDPCSLDLRRRALGILLRRADTAATSAAISVAKNNDETLELRIDAVNYLSRLPGENALAALEDLLRNSTDRELQRAAVRALANSENTRARSSVRMIIERNDVSEELRSDALSSFSKDRNAPEDATYLRALYSKMQSEKLKMAVLSAISRMGGTENDQFLLTVARNAGEATDVRSSAISRLARSQTTISVGDLSKLYDAAESRSLRSQVVNALSQRKEPEALDKLIDILNTSTDTNVRSQVLGVLGRSSDPKAKQALVNFASRN